MAAAFVPFPPPEDAAAAEEESAVGVVLESSQTVLVARVVVVLGDALDLVGRVEVMRKRVVPILM
jgi:hypothetical protein